MPSALCLCMAAYLEQDDEDYEFLCDVSSDGPTVVGLWLERIGEC